MSTYLKVEPAVPAGFRLAAVPSFALRLSEVAPGWSSMRPKFHRHPTLPFVEARQAFDSAACYRPHTHPTLSIGIVDAGESVLTLPQKRIALKPGDLVVIEPHEVHACNPRRDLTWSYRMLYIDANWLLAGRAVTRWKVPIRAASARAAFDRVFAILVEPQPPADAAATIRALLRIIVRAARPSSDNDEPTAIDPMDRLRDHIAAHCDEPLRLSQLSRLTDLPPCTLIRRFKRRFGLTPHAYQLDQRVVRARELLKNAPAADVAHSLGFADQSHLIRVFKPRVAATPREYVS